MADITTTNPYTGKSIKEYNYFTEERIAQCLQEAESAFKAWSKEDIAHRTNLLKRVAELLLERKDELSILMAQEMGKPVTQGKSEIEKCAQVCDFYAKNAASFLSDALIDSEANESFISHDPIGTVLAIMPWNFPFWQVVRFAAPTLTAGNTAILKHAENVTGCALALEQLFLDAGYPKGCFQVVLTDHNVIENMIGHDAIKAVSLTGSEKAGRAVAQTAGKNLKKAVLELGGNNACIVWEDADLDKHIDTMVKARMQNNGQSCIAAKRFIVLEAIYDEFLEKFEQKVKALKAGKPEEEDTFVSVMARADLAEGLEDQVLRSTKMGAKVVLGNKRDKAYFEPTILVEVTKEMPVFHEETFGPVAAVIKVKDRQAALDMAIHSDFGLGTMLFTQDIEEARKIIGQIPDGAFFINEMVKSDPNLPFGGTKNSGYGRELSKEGMMEFVNKKTVYVK